MHTVEGVFAELERAGSYLHWWQFAFFGTHRTVLRIPGAKAADAAAAPFQNLPGSLQELIRASDMRPFHGVSDIRRGIVDPLASASLPLHPWYTTSSPSLLLEGTRKVIA